MFTANTMDFLNNHHAPEVPRINYLDPRLSTYNLQPPIRNDVSTIPKIDHEKDRQKIDLWLMSNGKFQAPAAPLSFPQKPRTELNIHSSRAALAECIKIVEVMAQTQAELETNVETMSSAEWKEKSVNIAALKDKFDKLMAVFEDNVNLNGLKVLVKKRAKKRANGAKRKRFLAAERCAAKAKLLAAHESIDLWLEGRKEDVERAKMEETMKKDADCVLYEVTKKKSEARKQLSLISALVKLRTVRDNMATQRGEKLSLEDRQAFGSVTEKLIRMWESSCQNYCKEEQCLQLMLEDNATKDTQQCGYQAKEKRIADEWECVVFGPKYRNLEQNSTYWALTSADRDMETFIAIRKSWDTFLRNPTNTMGSGIPVGWILPPNNPSESWATYLTQNEY